MTKREKIKQSLLAALRRLKRNTRHNGSTNQPVIGHLFG